MPVGCGLLCNDDSVFDSLRLVSAPKVSSVVFAGVLDSFKSSWREFVDELLVVDIKLFTVWLEKLVLFREPSCA